MAHGTAACRLGASMRDVFRSAEADTLVAAPLTADRAPDGGGAGRAHPAGRLARRFRYMHRPPVAIRCCIRFVHVHRPSRTGRSFQLWL
jgi:hypothetical protein